MTEYKFPELSKPKIGIIEESGSVIGLENEKDNTVLGDFARGATLSQRALHVCCNLQCLLRKLGRKLSLYNAFSTSVAGTTCMILL